MTQMKLKEIKADEEFYTGSKMNIFQRMLAVEKELGVVAKNLEIQATRTSGYKAVSERDVIDAVKPLEAKHGIYSYPYSRSVIKDEVLENARPDGTIIYSKFLRLETVYRFVNVDKPEEYVEVTTYGDGIDTGDKGTGKAMTYADKYALMKAYKISTGDDPDAVKSADDGYRVTITTEPKATAKQVAWIKANVKENPLPRYGLASIDELTVKQASEIINEHRR